MSTKGIFSEARRLATLASQQEGGVRKGDIDGLSIQMIKRMQREGLLFTIDGRMGTTQKRYFDTQPRADEFYGRTKRPNKPVAKPGAELVALPYPTAWRGGTGPARLEGEPIITAQTKFTYGKAPTGPVLRTNTHLGSA